MDAMIQKNSCLLSLRLLMFYILVKTSILNVVLVVSQCKRPKGSMNGDPVEAATLQPRGRNRNRNTVLEGAVIPRQ